MKTTHVFNPLTGKFDQVNDDNQGFEGFPAVAVANEEQFLASVEQFATADGGTGGWIILAANITLTANRTLLMTFSAAAASFTRNESIAPKPEAWRFWSSCPWCDGSPG